MSEFIVPPEGVIAPPFASAEAILAACDGYSPGA